LTEKEEEKNFSQTLTDFSKGSPVPSTPASRVDQNPFIELDSVDVWKPAITVELSVEKS
jgi:hypothetical protein